MPMMDWNDRLSVGVPSIDGQHMMLLGMANELCDAMQAKRGKDVLRKTLDGLINYTVTHFKYEEKLFAETGYAAAAQHTKEHEDLTKQVLEIQEKVEKGLKSAQSIELVICLSKWLTNHIQGSDKAYGPHLSAKGIK